jgi:hypothetical protein
MERQLIVLWYGRLVLANRSRVDLAHHLFDGRSAVLILGIVNDADQSSQSTNDKTIQDVRINNQFILRLGLFPKNENNLQHYFGMLGYFWLFVWACLFALYQAPFAGFV